MEKRKILIVEDEKDSLEVMGRYLDRKGYQTFLAKDGQAAYQIARDVLPDVIVTDIIMPNMDGNQLIRKIREAHFGKKIYIIVITARKNMSDYFKTIGVDDFIAKPFTPEQITTSIENVLTAPRSRPLSKAMRVLIAGNHSEDLEKMAAPLREETCQVETIISGNQVISRAATFLPQVIILDAEMHEIGSHELISILRQIPQFKKSPILIYRHVKSGFLSHADKEEEVRVGVLIERCLEKGATKYIGHFEEKTFKDKMSKYISLGSIVLVDDDESMVRLIKTKVEALGYRFFAAPEGQSGLDLIRKVNPNLILLDVVMPGMEGYMVLDILKHDPDLHETPVIMVTIKNQEEDVQRGLSLGADDYVPKPVCMDLLLKKIDSLVHLN